MSITDDTMLSLINRIYSTVESPELWPDVMRGIAGHTDTPRSLLFTPYHGMHDGGLWFGHNLGTEELEEYIDYYHQTDIWTLRAFAREIPTNLVVNCDKLVAPEELDRTEFYNDYLKRIDIRGALGVMFGGEGTSFPRVHVCVYRPNESSRFAREAEDVMKALTPHMHRAIDLGFRFAELRSRARGKLDALNHLEFAVAALNQDATIAFMNRRAERILTSDDGLALRRHCIVAENHGDNEQLWKLLRNTIGARSKGRTTAGGSVAISRPSSRRKYAVTVAPGAGVSTVAGIPSAWALVFIADPELHPELPAERISRLYGLTSAEAQLAIGLAMGQPLNEYAETALLSMHTVRSTLKKVFAKTDTRRQAELVRLILTTCAGDAGLPGPDS